MAPGEDVGSPRGLSLSQMRPVTTIRPPRTRPPRRSARAEGGFLRGFSWRISRWLMINDLMVIGDDLMMSDDEWWWFNDWVMMNGDDLMLEWWMVMINDWLFLMRIDNFMMIDDGAMVKWFVVDNRTTSTGDGDREMLNTKSLIWWIVVWWVKVSYCGHEHSITLWIIGKSTGESHGECWFIRISHQVNSHHDTHQHKEIRQWITSKANYGSWLKQTGTDPDDCMSWQE